MEPAVPDSWAKTTCAGVYLEDLVALRPDLPEEVVADCPGEAVTLAAALCFGSPRLGALPPATCMQVQWFRFGLAEATALGSRPLWTRIEAPPAHSAVSAVTAELALRLHPDPAGRSAWEQLLSEVLVNALAHRSFHPELLDAPVVVNSYADAVRIHSPGGLAGPVQLEEGRLSGRWSRNPVLASYLTQVGMMRQQGTGAALAGTLAERLRAGLDLEASDTEVVGTIRTGNTTVPSPPEGRPAPRQRIPLSDLKSMILNLLARGTPLGARAIATDLGAPASSTRKALRELIEEGAVARTQPSSRAPNQRYVVADPEAS